MFVNILAAYTHWIWYPSALTVDMSQYYKGKPDIPKYIFMLQDAQRKAARASLPVTNQTLTILLTTALIAADTFPRTTKLWKELNPADKTWAAWKTVYLAAHKIREPTASTQQVGADNLGQANSAHANNRWPPGHHQQCPGHPSQHCHQ